MNRERLTLEQIKEKYPNQWVGLVDCEMEDSINIRSAVVKCTEEDMSSDLMALETVKGNMKAIYTTPNDTRLCEDITRNSANDMDSNDNISFEINGNDYINLKKFQKQHTDCCSGMAGEQFEYTFIPSGLGLAISVKCSCGQTLTLGDFMDYDSGEYSEKDHRVLTDNDRQNKNFEEAVKLILQMKNPRIYKMAFGEEQSFDMIYAISVYGIASIADERISRCILRKYTIKDGKNIDNYEGLNEKEKIEKFFNHFEKCINVERQTSYV